MNQTAKSNDSTHRQPVYRTVLAVIGTGLLTAMAFPGYNQWYLAWVSLVPLLLTIRSASPREGFRRAYIAGFVFNGLILSWMLGLVYWAGSIVLLGISLLVAYMALYWAVFGWTFCRLRSFGRWYPVLFGPLVWAVLEYLQGKLFSGFGWGLIGNTQIADIAVAQCAAVGGVYLVSAIV
ncbi:MAG: hypothetical protein J7M12_05540, partial [Candidatus Hydrogenedentes bacterium]|nr:hypothetical protein [Candidatus Hydrogenedentota bacterium]